MRLSTAQRLALKQRVSDELGPDCEIRVFGSRADDGGRGGDVDLLVQCPRRLVRKVWLAARLAASAERALAGRKVDVPAKAAKELGWRASRTLDQMCESTWNYWQRRGPNS